MGATAQRRRLTWHLHLSDHIIRILVEIQITNMEGRNMANVRKRKRLVIRDPATLRAIRSPVRHEIVEALDRLGASSVAEIAGELGRKAASLYYHIHDLTDAGILIEVGKKPSARRTESVYDLAAEKVIIDRRTRSPEFLEELQGLHRSALRRAEREMAAAVRHPASESRPENSAVLLRMSVRLSPGNASEARRRMLELVDFLSEQNEPEAPDAFALTLAFAHLASKDEEQ